MSFILAVLSHTPVTAWALLAFLVWRLAFRRRSRAAA